MGGVIGQATVAMFVRVELRDLCGREAEPEKCRCGFEGFARSGIDAKGACVCTITNSVLDMNGFMNICWTDSRSMFLSMS